MGFKKVQENAYYNEDNFTTLKQEGGKYYLSFVGGVRTEITADIYNALIDGLAPINNVYYYFSDAVSKVWKKQIGTGGGGSSEPTPFVVGQTYNAIYFDTSKSVEEMDALLQSLTYDEESSYPIYYGKDGEETYPLLVAIKEDSLIGILAEDVNIYCNQAYAEAEGVDAGWQKASLSGDEMYYQVGDKPSEMRYIDFRTCYGYNAQPFMSATPFGGESATYAYYAEFNNGVVCPIDKTAFDAFSGNDYFSLNGVYYGLGLIHRAYELAGSYFVELKNGGAFEITSDEYTAITNSDYFKSVRSSYYNSVFFSTLKSENGEYFLDLVGGMRLKITADEFSALTSGLTPINGLYYYYVDTISKAWKKQIGTEEGGGSSEPTQFVVGQTYDKVYFDTSKSVEEMIEILSQHLIESQSTYLLAYTGSSESEEPVIVIGAAKTNEHPTQSSFYYIVLSGDESETFVWASGDWEDLGLSAGWQNLESDGSYSFTSSEMSEVNNQSFMSATPFGGEPVLVPVYEYHIEFDNGVVLKTNKDAYDSIIADGYYSVNDVYCHENIINSAYKVGTKYEVEFDDGKKVEISQTEYEAIITEPEES